MIRRIGRAFLVILIALAMLGLLVFFVVMFFAPGRDGVGRGHDRIMETPGQATGVQSETMSLGEGAYGRDKSQKSDPVSPQTLSAEDGSVSAVPPSSVSAGSLEERKIRKSGNLDIRVKNADEAVARIRDIASERGGSVADSSFFREADNTKRGSVTVKVPIAQFEGAFDALKQVQVAALVISENIFGSDVTEQYVDLAARLKSKQAQEEALQNLLSRAEKVGDIIEITRELGQVRGEIESLQAQLRYLDTQTEMASITLFITEDARLSGDPTFRPIETITASLKSLLAGLGYFVNGLITFVIVGLPLLLAYGILLWLVFRGVRTIVKRVWR